jgi:hypothetical protein
VFDVLLRLIALVACSIIALSFVLFAAEQASDASKGQVSAVVDPGGAKEQQRQALGHTKAREIIDDADDIILRPFAGAVNSQDAWVNRGVPTLLGLLVYGFLILFLARLLKIRSSRLPMMHHHHEPAASAAATASPTGGSTPPPGAGV